MRYNINVAERTSYRSRAGYKHLFDTDLTGEVEAKRVLTALLVAFPSPQFRVSVTKWENTGKQLNINEFLSQS